MGNTDSQQSGLTLPGKPRACSLKLHPSREAVLSPHSWWRSTGGAPGYKARWPSRSGLSQHKSNQPYVSCHYEYISNKQHPGSLRCSERDHEPLTAQGTGCYAGYSRQDEGCGPSPTVQNSSSEPLQNRSSPKVLFSEDGSLRVEFTTGRREMDDQLPLAGRATGTSDSTLRDSKGSSLSSEASWYDSPWGPSMELCDSVFTPGQPSDDSSGYTTLSSTQTEDVGGSPAPMEGQVSQLLCQAGLSASQCTGNGCSTNSCNTTGLTDEDSGICDLVLLPLEQKDFELSSVTDLCTHPKLSVPFPTHDIFPAAQDQDIPKPEHLDAPSQEQSPDTWAFSSLTLPCRKSVPDGDTRKGSLKSRIRRLGDWTGSLSRKKRRLQDPSTLEASEAFISGVDGLAGDSVSPWWTLASNQMQSSCSLTDPYAQRGQSATVRQNIYKNFMQELEAGSDGGGVADALQAWEVGGDVGESSSSSLGSLEQMDLLFEKEQGVVRRAGWLAFKPLISLHKDRKLELVARRRWRQYWVTLKGCMLLLSEANSKGCLEQETIPRYALLAEDSIVQAVPEHPKKEYVFCLSNAFGDVYLFQAANQTDVENWVTAIHSACASHVAKRQGREDTVRLLRNQSRALLQKIDMDGKMKKMAELQLSVISDQKNRKAVESQIQQWEQNLEKFNVELFRIRCYLASLQGTETPNPKNLLAVAGRPSKMALSRLGIFSVSSFHALMCTRAEATLKRRWRSQSRGMRTRRGIFSSQKGLDSLSRHDSEKRQSLSQIFEGHPPGPLCHPPTPSCSEQRLDSFGKLHSTAPPDGHSWDCGTESLLTVYMLDDETVRIPVKQDFLVADILSLACKDRQLDPMIHCLRVKRCSGEAVETSTPAPSDLLRDLVYDELEVRPLDLLSFNMSRPGPDTDFGFFVTGHVDGMRRTHIYVSEVHSGSLAFIEGLREGDEILAVNGLSMSTLDLGLMQTSFGQQSLQLVVRREEPDEQSKIWPDCDSSVPYCPLLPLSQSPHTQLVSSDVSPLPEEAHNKASQCRKSVETLNTLCQVLPEEPGITADGHDSPYSTDSAPTRRSPRHMSVTERLWKVIQELVDTEKSYVKDLGCLFEIYLKPLERETFLSLGEMESLFGSLPEMLDFQRVFLQTLEERTTSPLDLRTLETPEQLKKMLFSLGGSFLYYADHFKLYSGFCANHIKVQKVLERAKTDRAFKEFLEARNPTKQHSSTLESYLIKPVQRVLKYPLLLRELVSLTDPESEEHSHLTEALRAMEKVASHINEMQKIYEDYGIVFDQLVAEQSSTEKEVTEISIGEFLIHSAALWLNPLPSLGRMRKEPELTLFIFKRAIILVYRDSSKLKKRMTASRSGDLDPFKFRWLIPSSCLHVRPGNSAGSENPCLWELVHTKSELEGRPETVFQLCSSSLQSKARAVKAIRCLLRENARRNAPPEKAFRGNLTFPRRSHPLAGRSGSWLERLHPQAEAHKGRPLNESGLLGGDTHSEPALPSHPHGAPGDKISNLCKRARLGSLTSSLEAQLQSLTFSEEPPGASWRPSNDLQASQIALLKDSSKVDLSSLLARDYSVQSLSSVVTEDCFYDTVMGIQKATIPTL
ncbi:T-lymphoma invasion and metastasis-inducing protein 2 isoform X1 [Electrophorus electricus]|uniref:T-lymphoma invasion and metastasis-inducing protein 2 isoform X1 n=1 Tax=Electrophorus electricus TaxID=8005 RepID=UPI0015CFB30A|nr:T-lymphoma invasion and metastasis-inducing protein 2 isoform X1 [Electrophorus electricus]